MGAKYKNVRAANLLRTAFTLTCFWSWSTQPLKTKICINISIPHRHLSNIQTVKTSWWQKQKSSLTWMLQDVELHNKDLSITTDVVHSLTVILNFFNRSRRLKRKKSSGRSKRCHRHRVLGSDWQSIERRDNPWSKFKPVLVLTAIQQP